MTPVHDPSPWTMPQPESPAPATATAHRPATRPDSDTTPGRRRTAPVSVRDCWMGCGAPLYAVAVDVPVRQ